MKKPALLFIIVTILTSLLAVVLFNGVVNGKPNFIGSCSEAEARHLTNIKSDSVYYRPQLDKDNDGIACEHDNE